MVSSLIVPYLGRSRNRRRGKRRRIRRERRRSGTQLVSLHTLMVASSEQDTNTLQKNE